MKIYKYDLFADKLSHEIILDLPAGARLLTVQTQHELPRLWALIDETAPTVKRTFNIYGTGHPVENANSLVHVGTFKMNNDMFVWHVFERVR